MPRWQQTWIAARRAVARAWTSDAVAEDDCPPPEAFPPNWGPPRLGWCSATPIARCSPAPSRWRRGGFSPSSSWSRSRIRPARWEIRRLRNRITFPFPTSSRFPRPIRSPARLRLLPRRSPVHTPAWETRAISSRWPATGPTVIALIRVRARFKANMRLTT